MAGKGQQYALRATARDGSIAPIPAVRGAATEPRDFGGMQKVSL